MGVDRVNNPGAGSEALGLFLYCEDLRYSFWKKYTAIAYFIYPSIRYRRWRHDQDERLDHDRDGRGMDRRHVWDENAVLLTREQQLLYVRNDILRMKVDTKCKKLGISN